MRSLGYLFDDFNDSLMDFLNDLFADNLLLNHCLHRHLL